MPNLTLAGLVGRFSKRGDGSENALRQTSQGSLAVGVVESPGDEVLRAGRAFGGGCQVIASGIAPVAAIPTTTATLALWNGEADGGASYFVDMVHFLLGSGTAAAGASLYVALSNAKLAAPTAASNYSSQSRSRGARTTKAVWATAQTFASGSAWFCPASSFQLAAANVGQGDLPASIGQALMCIPPGYAMGIGILSGAGTTPLYQVSALWRELEVDLE